MLLLAAVLAACGATGRDLILATTTSTENSGLLSVLIPAYEERSGDRVKVIAVGSGAALALGERGDADLLLVHSPDAETAYMAAGHGAERVRVMYNDFVIVGPAGDPAGVAGAPDAAAAMRAIAAIGAPFISRGDDSGTHAREQALWRAAQLPVPTGQSWYVRTGQGMGATLTVAAARSAYTLTDRATLLSFGPDFPLRIWSQGDAGLLNVYHLILVNPELHPDVNAAGARRFRDFLLAPATLNLIASFGRQEYGQSLFTPYPEEG